MATRNQEPAGYRGYPAQTGPQEDSISVIDQYSNFDGTYNSTRDLRVEGQVKGTISCRGTLFVAQGASVNATVEAENISVAGELEGTITCRGRLQLLPSGRAKGTIHTQTLVIHEGAFYEGDLTMGATEGRSSRSARRAAPSASAGTAASAPAAAPAGSADEPAATAEPTASRAGERTTPSPAQGNFLRRFSSQENEARPAEPAPSRDEDV